MNSLWNNSNWVVGNNNSTTVTVMLRYIIYLDLPFLWVGENAFTFSIHSSEQELHRWKSIEKVLFSFLAWRIKVHENVPKNWEQKA